MDTLRTARTGMFFAFTSAILLMMMFAAGTSVSSKMDLLGQAAAPEAVAEAIKSGAQGLTLLLAIDNLFLIAYTGTFISGTALFWNKAKLFGVLTLIFSTLLALLDLTENALIIHMARSATAEIGVTAGQIAGLALVEQVKYGSASLALAWIGVGILTGGPVRSLLQKVMAGTFFLFGPVNALKVVQPDSSLLLVFWMLVMIVVSGMYFRQVAETLSQVSDAR